MQKHHKFRTGLALLTLLLSLTSCQAAVPPPQAPETERAETAQTPPDTAAAPNASIEAFSIEAFSIKASFICTYTGILADITEHDASYPHYAALKNYLDGKQFALLRLAHIGEPHIFEGCETQNWQFEDWELVMQYLENPSASDQGYGKADFNNDGTDELLYRTVHSDRQLSATVYQTDDSAEQIVDEYSLMDRLPDTAFPDCTLQQLWFQPFGGEVVTFRLLRKDNSEEFVILSDIVSMADGRLTCSRLETRKLTVTAEPADSLAQTLETDIFRCRILNLAADGESSQTLDAEQLVSCQEARLRSCPSSSGSRRLTRRCTPFI